MKFVFVNPKIEPIEYDFDVDQDPQRYINQTVSQQNKMSIDLFDLDIEEMSLKPFKSLEIDFSFKELYYEDNFMIFLILGKKFNHAQIWALKKDFELIKLFSYGFENNVDKIDPSDDGDDLRIPKHGAKKQMRFELDFSKGSTRVCIEDYVLNVTFTIKKTVSLGEIGMMVRDIGFSRENKTIFREIAIDLRKFKGLVYENKNADIVMDWKDKINIVKW